MIETDEFSKQKEELYHEKGRLLKEAETLSDECKYEEKVKFQTKVVITMLNELLCDVNKGDIKKDSESFTAFYVLSAFVDYISEFMRETLKLMDTKDIEGFSNFINRKNNDENQ